MRMLARWQRNGTVLAVCLFLVMLQPLLFAAGESEAALDVYAEEARMLQMVNQARNSAGLPPLLAEQRLTQMARSYSREMIDYNFFGHVSPVSGDLRQRIAAHNISGWNLAGENIAKAPSVDVAFQALMNSPSHRENILRAEFNCVGIGVVQGNNSLFITQEFMRFTSIPSTADRGAVPVPAQAPTPAPPENTFDTYLLLMNPNDKTAQVEVTFQCEEGTSRSFAYDIGANSRFTIPVRESVGCGSFSAGVRSDIPVLAERAMYFDYKGRRGGHDSIGAIAPSRTWFFAEGYTGRSFDTWVLLQNPNASPAAVTLSFMRPDGAVITQQLTISPNSRHSVHLDVIPGLENTDVSTQVSSDIPVVAERAMYFDYGGKDGGHGTIGASSPSNTWFFAEGCTAGSFDTWVLLQNPGDGIAAVTLDFMLPDGSTITREFSVPGRRRHSVHVNTIAGLESTDVSTRITSDLPIVAERAMYFDHKGRKGGHVTIGAAAAKRQWYLAEGYTGGGFDQYVLLLNPGDEAASVDMVFMRPDGAKISHEVEMRPRSRSTVYVNSLQGLGGTEVSTKVTADNPVVVELAQYFDFRGLADGSNSIGACEPSTDWFFAEGCVR